jgi:hypothetical protein
MAAHIVVSIRLALNSSVQALALSQNLKIVFDRRSASTAAWPSGTKIPCFLSNLRDEFPET